MNLFEQAIVFVLGLCFGSFANVCIYRIPLNQSLIKPASRCPNCGKTLRWWHNIPLLSFLFLRARCAFCLQPISWRYPLGEIGFALLFWLTIVLRRTPPEMALAGGILVFMLWVICFIDLKHRIIPDVLSLSLLAAGIFISPWNNLLGSFLGVRVFHSVLGGAFGFGLMFLLAWAGEKIFHREAMGGGDIKLMAGLGVFLGWQGVWGTLFLASIVGTIWAFGLIAIKKARQGSYLPFGPFLALGAWLLWVGGEKLIFASFLMPWGW